MLRSNRRATRGSRCAYGCCTDHLTARQERRLRRRQENQKWKKEWS
jgi:hypothetical protein